MYCENCGRQLNAGEICVCQQKKNKNISAVISLILALIGLAVVCFVYVQEDMLTDRLETAFLKQAWPYLKYGMPALLFLAGLLFGITAVKKVIWETVSWMAWTLNILGLLAMLGFLIWAGMSEYRAGDGGSERTVAETEHKTSVQTEETESETEKETVETESETKEQVAETEKTYEKLADNVLIDAYLMETETGKVNDTYGVQHDGGKAFYTGGMQEQSVDGGEAAIRSSYALFNIDRKYVDFSGQFVTGQKTDTGASMELQIYLDDNLIFKKEHVGRATECVPFSVNVENGKILKIVCSEENNMTLEGCCYLVNDKLSFEYTEDIKRAEEKTAKEMEEDRKTKADLWETEKSTDIEKNKSAGAEEQKTETERRETEKQTEDEKKEETVSEKKEHSYELYQWDATWEDAYWKCIDMGGYLARIDDMAEYDRIVQKLEKSGHREMQYFIGGRRELDSQKYQWAYETNILRGETLNETNAWCASCWLDGEPSFRDNTVNSEEHVMIMYYNRDKEKWVWNDVPNDVLAVASNYRGKIGFICEMEKD